VSRTASTSNRTNDRLQERLARAIAAKNTQQKAEKSERADSLALSSGVPSRTGSPITFDSPRRSVDGAPVVEKKNVIDGAGIRKTEEQLKEEEAKVAGDAGKSENTEMHVQPKAPEAMTAMPDVEALPRISIESAKSHIPRASIDSTAHSAPRSSIDAVSTEVSEPLVAAIKTPAEYETILKQLQTDFEAAELSRQEEIHDYIEKIDTLQSKLQYLAKESADAARKTSEAAPSGSVEKKLADKEEQIALLMEEGQKLSKKELTLQTTIKKLRAKIQEDSKEVTDAKAKQEKAEKDISVITERWKKAQTAEKRLNERQNQVMQLQRDMESLKRENDSKDSTIHGLKRQLEEATSQAKQAGAKATQESLLAEKRRVKELEDDIANLKIEKNLVSDRAQAQLKEMKEKMEKDSERVRMTELEMKNEQQMLESKLEVMRARAEEVSSGSTGDAQAKLLRQIETLQTQYAVAGENWQGIEASLVARAANLEKERDEATKREADIRRKAREVVCSIYSISLICILMRTDTESQAKRRRARRDSFKITQLRTTAHRA
jgi:chromosome segregation ATPase